MKAEQTPAEPTERNVAEPPKNDVPKSKSSEEEHLSDFSDFSDHEGNGIKKPTPTEAPVEEQK